MKKIIIITMFIFTLTCIVPTQVSADVTNPVAATTHSSMEFLATKMPLAKNEIIMKFLLAMLGVVTSSVVIYVLLSLYNKFIYGRGNGDACNETDNDFKTPTNMKDALNIFLKKTK